MYDLLMLVIGSPGMLVILRVNFGYLWFLLIIGNLEYVSFFYYSFEKLWMAVFQTWVQLVELPHRFIESGPSTFYSSWSIYSANMGCFSKKSRKFQKFKKMWRLLVIDNSVNVFKCCFYN